MGVFIRQNDNRSQLQERLAAELQEKAKLQASSPEPLDQASKSNYIKDTEATSDRLWVWIVIVAVVVVGVAVFVISR